MEQSLDEISIADACRDGVITSEELLAESGESFGDLVQACGEMAARLVDAYGGTRLYVPCQLDPGGRLAQELGEQSARTLISLCEGEDVVVPRLMSLRRMIRNKKIVALHANGASPPKLALHFNLTERQIQSILRRHRAGAERNTV
ncbi:hypothetical protein GCM10007160_25440 [Litchfieldella qijiaojingensis]|uniref:Mor transcription activator domain-containing protein n=1 Tax=Litchfieldella qijiaojingensis TaxID=980347 RepID=A0ABQ2YZ17_9GAMM|nr:Mor transcription activator family protein [Halomonas qijiaojingensis]GGX96726.1 hypothetical protein GCM10007160_25440 [Halomonas qijiaojingensis]